MQKITIIGGTSGFWKWLAKFIKKDFSTKVDITIVWRDKQKGEKIAKEINCIFSNDCIWSVKDADIVIISVPINITENIIKQTLPFVKKWAFVCDTTSVKIWPSKAMKKHAPSWVTTLPCHPMFWPFISSLADQTFIFTPEKKGEKDARYIFLRNYLQEKKAKIIETTPEEHDMMMGVVQWLTHFSMFSLAKTLEKLDIDVKKTCDFVSPIYKIMISSIGRYAHQNSQLYADIQVYNQKNIEIQKVFLETVKYFYKATKKKNEKKIIKLIEKSKKHFEKTREKWQMYTDKIIFLLTEQKELLKRKKWKIIHFTNIYDNKKEKGRLVDFDEEFFFLQDGTKKEILKYYIS